jgi:hypothetical protein
MGKEILIAAVTAVVVFALVANVSALGSLTGFSSPSYSV